MPNPVIPQINGSSVDLKITSKVLQNFVQGDCEKDDKGVYSGYSANELGAGWIRIPKPVWFPVLPRTLGASVNGGSYSGLAFQVSNTEYMLPVLDVVDNPIDVPLNNTQMFKQITIDDYGRQIGMGISVSKNGICLATKVFKSFFADVANQKVFTFNTATDSLRNKLDYCEDVMNEGIPDLGVDMFPETTRRILFLNGYTPYFRQTGSFIVGGSNLAQEMLKTGAASPNDTQNALMDGYRGTYGNVDMNLISDMKVNMADGYLGLPKGTLKACGLVAVESSSYANHFGLIDNGVQTMSPTPLGQGTRLNPNYRFGAATLFAQGNAFIVTSNWVNPFAVFSIFTGITPSVIAPGARVLDFAAVVASTAATTATLSATVTTRTQAGAVNTGVAYTPASYAWVQTNSAITTLAAFITAYNAATSGNKGVGATTALTGLTAGKYVTAVAVASDGTISACGSSVVA